MNVKLIATGSSRWDRLIRRWGLSYLIDDDVLFDTFACSKTLLRNLRRYGSDAVRIRHVVISHEHWDHTGGLWKLLENQPRLTVHVPAQMNNELKDRICRAGAKIVEGQDGHKVKDGIHVSRVMKGRHNGKPIFEQALVLERNGRLMVLTGCGHPGIVNIVDAVKKTFNAPIHGIIGGFHYVNGHAANDIRKHTERLKESGVEMVAPAHCTGAMAEKIFREAFPHSCVSLQEGQCVVFGSPEQ